MGEGELERLAGEALERIDQLIKVKLGELLRSGGMFDAPLAEKARLLNELLELRERLERLLTRLKEHSD